MAGLSVPILWGGDLKETVGFYRALGYRVTREQTRPYTYGVVERDGFELHFGPTPRDLGTAEAAHVSCLVFVDEVASLHEQFTTVLRSVYGRVPARGIPRITRFRPGQTRFSVVDPVGNTVIYIRRDEPSVEYGGARGLEGLSRVLDNARILRDAKNDDATAVRAIETGLRRFAAMSTPMEMAQAYAMLAEIAVAAGDADQARMHARDIARLDLSDSERAAIARDLAVADQLSEWLRADSSHA